MKFQKIAIGIVMATSLVSCVGNQDNESLSTKSPVLNKVRLSGYSSKYYSVDDLSTKYKKCSVNKTQPIINDGGLINAVLCENSDVMPRFFKTALISVKDDETNFSYL